MANALEDLASVILAGRATFATNVSWVDRGSMRLEKDLRSIFRDIEKCKSNLFASKFNLYFLIWMKKGKGRLYRNIGIL